MKKYLNNLKASSLANAIFICVIISAFSGSLVLISHYQNMLNNQIYMHEDLINRNDSSFNYLLNNAESITYNQPEMLDVFEDNILSYLEKKSWGFYDVFISKTIFKNDTISKIALVGQTNTTKNNLALYVTDYNKALKLSGNIKISGQIKIPNGRVENAYINGKNGNTIKLNGSVSKSDDRLPKINKDITIDISNYKSTPINTLDKGAEIINGFDKTTKIIDLNGINNLNNIVCKGNIILMSSNEIEIGSTAKLHDVLVIAPRVRVLSGFKGNIQIIAKETVNVDKDVSLLYPSSIYIKNNQDSIAVTINENSKVIGGVVIDSDINNSIVKRSLILKKGSTIVGNIYCSGSTQLEGTIIGSIYTDKFSLKTESSYYENMILNTTINRDSLPKNFIELPLFKNTFDKKRYAIIKEF